MQIISTDKTVRNDTIQDLKEFNSQCLSSQARKGEQLTSMMPAIEKAFADEKLEKIDCHISYIEKDYNEFKLQYIKQSVDDILIQRAIKTAVQILYDKGLFDDFQNADKVLEDFLFTTRRRGDLERVNGDVQWICS